jgi:hypothetical protein
MPRLATLRRRIELVRRASRFSPDRIPTSTRLPGGAVFHKAMSRLFLRQAIGILHQIKEFADRTLEALDAAAAVVESPDNHRHAELIELLDTHSELLAERSAAGEAPATALEGLERRVERLERAAAQRRWRPWFGRKRFAAAFDHGEAERLAQLTEAAVDGRVPVVTIGAQDSPLRALDAADDAGLGAVVATRVEEVMTAPQLADLVPLAYEKLAAGGRLVISCGAPPAAGEPRPVFDPTLGPTLPAAYAAFVCREAGFTATDVEEWPDGYLVVATR